MKKIEHDVEKFTEFYQKNWDKLVNRLLKAKGIDTREEAEDLAQKIFQNLWTSYDDNYYLYNEGYFWKYAVNFAIADHIRRKNTRAQRINTLKLAYELDRFEDEMIKERMRHKTEIYFSVKKQIPEKFKHYFAVAYWRGISAADRLVRKLDKDEKERFLDYVLKAYENLQ